MNNINIKIKSEVAASIILFIALFATIAIWIDSQSIDTSWSTAILRHKTAALPNNPNEGRILFASMGNRNIYKVQTSDNKWVVVMDNGQQSQAFDSVSNPTFSADGTQFAFSGTIAATAVVVLNNAVQNQTYTNISQIIFSPNGQEVAYVATTQNQQSVIVIDGKVSKSYQEIAPLSTPDGTTYAIFSPDGQEVAYKVVDDNGAYIVINGQAGKEYTDVSDFTFSADGTQFAYDAVINGQTVTVVNNQEIINNNPSGGTATTPTTPSTGNSSDSTTNWSSGGGHNLYDPSKLNFDSCKTKGGCNF